MIEFTVQEVAALKDFLIKFPYKDIVEAIAFLQGKLNGQAAPEPTVEVPAEAETTT